MKDLKLFKPILKYLKEEKKPLIISVILIIISSVLSVTYGYFNGAAIEAITKLNLKMSVLYFLCYFLISVFSSSILYKISTKMLRKTEIKITEKLSNVLMAKTLDLPAIAFEEKSSGELINKLTNDTSTLSYTFTDMSWMVVNLFCSLIVLIYIFMNSYIIGIVILTFMIIIYLITKYFNPKLKKISEKIKNNNDKYVSSINETIRGIREIKSLGIKENIFINTRNLMIKLFNSNKEELNLEIKFEIFTDILKSALEIGTFIVCAILFYNRNITLTFFIAMTYYVYRYTWIINSITNLSKSIQRMKVSLGRINDIIENKSYQDETFGSVNINNTIGNIIFKNVSFSYKKDKNVLNNFSINLKANKKIAIIGKSGQGKSTVFNLITRMFDPNKGNIYLDDVNIKDLSEYSLRKLITVIRQDPFIFNASIKENFKILNPNIKIADIRKYASLAYIDDYIMSLPKKYNTILGEGGVNLSGGQKQRLAIARTLTKNSKVILFDEATSSLDNESQTYIKKAIDNLVKDHTIIIIAHRLSTIIDADLIYVIDKGKVVASGNHQELIKTSKIYQTLYNHEI